MIRPFLDATRTAVFSFVRALFGLPRPEPPAAGTGGAIG
jgi:hypothetical protein